MAQETGLNGYWGAMAQKSRRKMSNDFLEGVECVRQMVIFDVVPGVKRSFQIEKDSDWAIQGKDGYFLS